MKYLLLVYTNESVWSREDREPYLADSVDLCHALEREGSFVAASPLQSTATASSVRVRDGQTITTDGPFAETNEQLGGYFLIDVDSEAEARAVAARIPAAKVGTVEVRPLENIENRLPAV
ncbi:YciI family protein [Gilvimarinus sp. F26214L]|uniref:YciI family protein n=1 Tax=Gilvimarinus sp. DZF01 TaxID=3461371 RepID=UPI0040460E2A